MYTFPLPRPLGILLVGLLAVGCASRRATLTPSSVTEPAPFDWQGHRGARGLLPENTVPAFLRALSYPEVTTLEMDVVITADRRVVVSHEPWMNPEICSAPMGAALPEGERVGIYGLVLAEVQDYDCGKLGNPRFPEQVKRPAKKPTLVAVFDSVARHCQLRQRPLPRFNIELKYLPEWEAEGLVPDRETFARLVLADIEDFGRPELISLQCFEPGLLRVLHEQNPTIDLVYLDETPGSIQDKVDALGFTPAVYSPWYEPLTQVHVLEAQRLGMRVIPWTVNGVEEMRRVKGMGVDGIITDYPDRVGEVAE